MFAGGGFLCALLEEEAARVDQAGRLDRQAGAAPSPAGRFLHAIKEKEMDVEHSFPHHV